jgi:hypothetical protein
MGSDVPITAPETAPATAAETAAQETVPETTAPETNSIISSLLAFGLFGLSPIYTYLIFGGALILLILLIVLIAVLLKHRKPKKTAPNVIVAKGPIYIASAQPPVALNQAAAAESDVKMIETSGEQINTDAQTRESEGTDSESAEDSGTGKDNAKDLSAESAATISEAESKNVSKKGKKSKKSVSPYNEGTGETVEDGKGTGEEIADGKGTGEETADGKKTGFVKKKFCVNCGSPVLDTNLFCANCGNKLK